MKLIDKVKDLSWPEGAVCCVQGNDGIKIGCIIWIDSMPCDPELFGTKTPAPDDAGFWWWRQALSVHPICDISRSVRVLAADLAEDWSTAIITRETWEAAQDNHRSEAAGTSCESMAGAGAYHDRQTHADRLETMVAAAVTGLSARPGVTTYENIAKKAVEIAKAALEQIDKELSEN